MKNFYEATGIRPNLKLEIVLRVKPVGNVKTRIQINDTSWAIDITKEELFTHEVNLNDPINIQIQITRHHPEALAIELEIDGNKILPKYQHLATPPTDYIDFDNTWSLKIPNFYPWYHTITGQGWVA